MRVAFQVSDRLVSVSGKEYEALSNKNVVMRTSDALISAGYTGIAYFGAKPTDRWLAETAWGAQLGTGIGLGGLAPPRLWQVTERLKRGLAEELLRRRLTKHFHQIILCGLRADRRGYLQPVIWILTHRPEFPGEVTLDRRGTRHLPPHRFEWFPVRQSDPGALGRMRLGLRDSGAESPEAFETILAEAVRQTSRAFPGTVGNDVMGIRLWLSSDGMPTAEVTYSPSAGALCASAAGRPQQITYSPWFLWPGGFASPASVSEISGWRTEHFEFTVKNGLAEPGTAEGVRPMSDLVWGSGARRPAPGYRLPVSSGGEV
jgi:hypothetical protein